MTQCYWFRQWLEFSPNLSNKIPWNFNRNTAVFDNENIFENVVFKKPAISLVAQCHISTIDGLERNTKQSLARDVIMSVIASQIISITIVYSIVNSDADQRKHRSSGDRWIPRTNGQLRGKCFHLMTSSWSTTDELPASNAGPWHILLEQAVQQAVALPRIWKAIKLMWPHSYVLCEDTVM